MAECTPSLCEKRRRMTSGAVTSTFATGTSLYLVREKLSSLSAHEMKCSSVEGMSLSEEDVWMLKLCQIPQLLVRWMRRVMWMEWYERRRWNERVSIKQIEISATVTNEWVGNDE
jgi:hypothetical protein